MTFTIPGIPKGQGRPRFRCITTKAGRNFASAYDPKDSRDWKQTVAATALAAGVRGLEGPLQVNICAYLPRPKRLCRKSDVEHCLYSTGKPDCDNITKGILDALIGVAYADDSQVAISRTSKLYHEKSGMPRTEVSIEPLSAPSVERAGQGRE